MRDSQSFKSNRKFKIWIYTVSHSTLILRSEKQYFDVNYDIKYDEPNTTIDIIFTTVDFISLPDKFEKIDIIREYEKFIFNNNKNWFVKAASCSIGKYEGENENDIWHGDLKYDTVIEL